MDELSEEDKLAVGKFVSLKDTIRGFKAIASTIGIGASRGAPVTSGE